MNGNKRENNINNIHVGYGKWDGSYLAQYDMELKNAKMKSAANEKKIQAKREKRRRQDMKFIYTTSIAVLAIVLAIAITRKDDDSKQNDNHPWNNDFKQYTAMLDEQEDWARDYGTDGALYLTIKEYGLDQGSEFLEQKTDKQIGEYLLEKGYQSSDQFVTDMEEKIENKDKGINK